MASSKSALGFALGLGLVGCGTSGDEGPHGSSEGSTTANRDDSGSSSVESSSLDAGGSSTTIEDTQTGGTDATSGTTDGDASTATSSEPATTDTGDDSPTTAGEDPAGSIDVTLDGCTIDFSGNIVVAYNGSLGVASLGNGGGQLTGSFQFDLEGPATFTLSTQQRIDTGTIVNMVDPNQGTWTNIDPDGATPDGVDSISGVLEVSVWEPGQGRAVLDFDGVTLFNTTTGSVCTIDGRVEATRLSV